MDTKIYYTRFPAEFPEHSRPRKEDWLPLQDLGLKKAFSLYAQQELPPIRRVKGKPFFPHEKDIHFSKSDHREHCVWAFSPKNIGIDLESVQERNFTAILPRFFSSNEQEYVLSLPENLRSAAFFHLFTLKEALLKYIGCGFGEGYSLHTLSFEKQGKNLESYRITASGPQPLYFHSFILPTFPLPDLLTQNTLTLLPWNLKSAKTGDLILSLCTEIENLEISRMELL